MKKKAGGGGVDWSSTPVCFLCHWIIGRRLVTRSGRDSLDISRQPREGQSLRIYTHTHGRKRMRTCSKR